MALKASPGVWQALPSPWGGVSFVGLKVEDLKVELVGSAWERKDHPLISLWAGAATM